MGWRALGVLATLGVLAALVGLLGCFAAQAGAEVASQRFSPLAEITASNVKNLRPVWSFSTGVLRGHEGAPLVVGDALYLVTPFPNIVYALDLNHDGAILWKYAPQQDGATPGVMCCDTVNRGLAFAGGKIFLHQADNVLVALDARTGEKLWAVKNGEIGRGETGTGAPFAVNNKILIGESGGEFGVRCHVSAYDQDSGKLVWRAYAEGPDAEIMVDPLRTTALGQPIGQNSSLASWQGAQWATGGGCAWGFFSYDPETNLVFYGTGNPSTWNPSQRPGDNKWAASIFARDADTGMARWVYQMTPHDEWDYDGVNEMILADLPIDGVLRKTLVHLDRNGFAYVLDRARGELISAEKFDTNTNWAQKIQLDKAAPDYGRPLRDEKFSTEAQGEDVLVEKICPASLGAKNEAPAAFSPLTGLVYAPTNRICMDYEPFRVHYQPGLPFVGATLSLYPPPGQQDTGAFIAWDPVARKILWSRPEKFAVWSGALATAGGVVFYGTLEGYLKAVDARTGEELYRYKTPSGIVGNVMSFAHQGRQYVAVLSGVGGWAGIGLAAGLTDSHDGAGAVGGFRALDAYTAPGGVLTVFALP